MGLTRDGSALVANTGAGTDIEGYNKLSHFTITGGEANYVVLENTGELTVMAKTSAKNTTIDAGGKLIVRRRLKQIAPDLIMVAFWRFRTVVRLSMLSNNPAAH